MSRSLCPPLIVLLLVLTGCTSGAAPTIATQPEASATRGDPAPLPSSHPTSTEGAPSTLLPDGAWRVMLSAAELQTAGAQPGALPVGLYTWTFAGTRARLSVAHDGHTDYCSAEASKVAAGVLLTYLSNLGCGGWQDTITWQVEEDGLHLTLVDSTAPREANAPYLEAKPWQRAPAEAIPSWPVWSIRCESGCHGPISAGTVTSSGFLPGMTLSFPGRDDWFNSRDDQDELEFDLADTALRFWVNPKPASADGAPIDGVERSVEGLTQWFLGNRNMLVSVPKKVTLGRDIAATTFTLAVSESNVNVDPDCPPGTRSCLNVLWVNEGHVFAIGYGSAERLYLVSLANGDVLVISLDAPNQATLGSVEPKLDRLLATLTLPPVTP